VLFATNDPDRTLAADIADTSLSRDRSAVRFSLRSSQRGTLGITFRGVPSTVAEILEAGGLKSAGSVRWGEAPLLPPSDGPSTGIYVVALTDRVASLDGVLSTATLSNVAVDELLAIRPELTLDGSRPTPQQVIERLSAFWLPDEVVLYIGLAGPRKNRPREGEVSMRVKEYYATQLGERALHSGGRPMSSARLRGKLRSFASP
jgi:hypothetical protein